MNGIVNHVSFGTTPDKFAAMMKFYDETLKAVGGKRIMIISTQTGKLMDKTIESLPYSEDIVAVAYGRCFPEFWIGIPHPDEGDNNKTEKESSLDENDATKKETAAACSSVKIATPGTGVHIAFTCKNTSHVDQVYKVAMEHGGTCDGPPGPRPQYSDKYYAAFMRDPMGNKIEAIFYDMGIFNYCTIL